MTRMFHCNKSCIFCNIFSSTIVPLTLTWEMPELLFITLGKIARGGEA